MTNRLSDTELILCHIGDHKTKSVTTERHLMSCHIWFNNAFKNKKYLTDKHFQKFNRKIIETEAKWIPQQIYMTAFFFIALGHWNNSPRIDMSLQ